MVYVFFFLSEALSSRDGEAELNEELNRKCKGKLGCWRGSCRDLAEVALRYNLRDVFSALGTAVNISHH